MENEQRVLLLRSESLLLLPKRSDKTTLTTSKAPILLWVIKKLHMTKKLKVSTLTKVILDKKSKVVKTARELKPD